jgi:hypothetical protein
MGCCHHAKTFLADINAIRLHIKVTDFRISTGQEKLMIKEIKAAMDIWKHTEGVIPKILKAINYMKTDYFYSEDLVKAFLLERDFTNLPRPPKSVFIDYPKYLDYYWQDIEVVYYKQGIIENSVQIPYKEEINFIENPNVQINVAGPIEQYEPSLQLIKSTEANLKAYLQKKPATTDGSVLRIASLKKIDMNRYECILQRSSYFIQARTNLTVDFPLEENSTKTLRILDMTNNCQLPTLEESILVNSLGVSAVVYYVQNGKRYFFMKLRKDSEGVFESMLGTTSGVVQLPSGQRITELVSYAQHEMLREFSRETGIDEDKLPIKDIKALSFTRELTRGGKPQFFFLIEIPFIDESNFRTVFRKSIEGLDEFYDNLLKNKTSFSTALSPEYSANLIYAFQYFQSQEKKKQRPILFD